jgi:3',5'-cyclic AMP phosphodiesterase CpdA
MVTIAHISDLHLSPEHRRKNIRATKRLLEYIGTLGVDQLVITGDIVANADKHDFQLARAILKSSGWLDSKSLSVVIGNHDIYGGVNHAEDILTFPKHCKHADYKRKVSEFYECFHEAFDKCLHVSQSSVFPYGKVVGDVVLVGMNSVAEYSRLGNPIGSNGEVSESEFEKTEKILSSDLLKRKRKVILIHHHFYKRSGEESGAMHSVWNAIEAQTMKLRGKKKLLKLFGESNVDLVLHGHLHENHEYWRKNIRFMNGGGSVLGNMGLEARCSLITITERSIETEQVLITDESGAIARGLESRLVTHAAA